MIGVPSIFFLSHSPTPPPPLFPVDRRECSAGAEDNWGSGRTFLHPLPWSQPPHCPLFQALYHTVWSWGMYQILPHPGVSPPRQEVRQTVHLVFVHGCCGCVVDGPRAMAAIWVLFLLQKFWFCSLIFCRLLSVITCWRCCCVNGPSLNTARDTTDPWWWPSFWPSDRVTYSRYGKCDF